MHSDSSVSVRVPPRLTGILLLVRWHKTCLEIARSLTHSIGWLLLVIVYAKHAFKLPWAEAECVACPTKG